MRNYAILRTSIEKAWALALRHLDPTNLVRTHTLSLMSEQPSAWLDQPPRPRKPQAPPKLSRLTPEQTFLLAAGKAAPAMAKGALDALGNVAGGLVVTTDGTAVPPFPDTIRVVRAAHPIPDSRSAHAARIALKRLRAAHQSHLIALISGGSSSLLCAPHQISLEQKQKAVNHLLRTGATIRECNTVRRHLSAVKGGRLAAAFHGYTHCMVLSDVIGGEPHDVGSGPACADPTTILDAREIIHAHLRGSLASACHDACTESLKPQSTIARRIAVSVLADPSDLAVAFAARLRAQGWLIHVPPPLETTAQELSDMLVDRARSLPPNHGCVVACEPTLTVPQNAGHGGRAGWVALRALMQLPPDTILWAGASDGIDGNSGSGGACVHGSQRRGLDFALARQRLDARDDAVVHRALGTALPGAPTGTNMTDVYAVLRP